jgi:hypothetical protein
MAKRDSSTGRPNQQDKLSKLMNLGSDTKANMAANERNQLSGGKTVSKKKQAREKK